MQKIPSYSGGSLLLCFKVIGESDSQVLSSIKDVVTTDMECQVPWKNFLTLALKIRI